MVAVAAAMTQMQVATTQVAEAGCSSAECLEAAGAVLSGGSAEAEQEEVSVVALVTEVVALAAEARICAACKGWRVRTVLSCRSRWQVQHAVRQQMMQVTAAQRIHATFIGWRARMEKAKKAEIAQKYLDILDREWARRSGMYRDSLEEGFKICDHTERIYECELCWKKMVCLGLKEPDPDCACGRERCDSCWQRARRKEDWSLTPPPWTRHASA